VAKNGIGFGIIGAGNIGPFHAEALEASATAHLACVCDVIEEKARALAEKYAVPYTTSLSEMLERDDVEAVCVCTPSGMHHTHAILAAEAGKHILCEKPLDITLAAMDEMVAAAEECEVKLSGVFQYRTMAGALQARAAIRGGKLGKLALGDCYQKYYRGHDYYASAGWRATWQWDGGGALMNQAVHGVDLIQFLVGPIARVNAHCRTLTRNLPVEDTAVILAEYECGALGVLEATTSVTPGYGLRAEVNGDRGSIALNCGDIAAWDIPGEEAPVPAPAHTGDTASNPLAVESAGHRAHVEDLCAAIAENRAPLLDGREARKAVEVIKAIYLSSREGGATIELPLSYDDDGPGILPRLGGPRLEW
jgi:predicted dehydrogenase